MPQCRFLSLPLAPGILSSFIRPLFYSLFSYLPLHGRQHFLRMRLPESWLCEHLGYHRRPKQQECRQGLLPYPRFTLDIRLLIEFPLLSEQPDSQKMSAASPLTLYSLPEADG
jgi:hypothetical protein